MLCSRVLVEGFRKGTIGRCEIWGRNHVVSVMHEGDAKGDFNGVE